MLVYRYTKVNAEIRELCNGTPKLVYRYTKEKNRKSRGPDTLSRPILILFFISHLRNLILEREREVENSLERRFELYSKSVIKIKRGDIHPS